MLGTIIEDRYRVEAELGHGAMGRVYRARHIKVGRAVAIKVMHPELAKNPQIVERFAREARIAARLTHPNLVGVLDVGTTPDQQPLIVLELAPGRSLADIATQALPGERVVGLIRQLLQGLAHAHAAGLIHRDLKPDNVLVESLADGREIARIVDFGIAVCCNGDDPIAAQRLTEANTVIGTPYYMSPEQAMAKPLDARTDLFSIGVIMYELLAGALPFDGTLAEVALANTTQDAPPIAARTGVAVDPALEGFIGKLMARRLPDRFQSALEALRALEELVSPLPPDRTPTTEEPVSEAVPERLAADEETDVIVHRGPRRRWLPALGGLLVAALVLVVAGVIASRGTAASAAQLAVSAEGDELALRTRLTAGEEAPRAVPVRVVAPVVAPLAAPHSDGLAACVPVPSTTEAPTPAPVTATDAQTVVARYVAVGKALQGGPDAQWARYRRIRINDAIATEAARQGTLATLDAIEHALGR